MLEIKQSIFEREDLNMSNNIATNGCVYILSMTSRVDDDYTIAVFKHKEIAEREKKILEDILYEFCIFNIEARNVNPNAIFKHVTPFLSISDGTMLYKEFLSKLSISKDAISDILRIVENSILDSIKECEDLSDVTEHAFTLCIKEYPIIEHELASNFAANSSLQEPESSEKIAPNNLALSIMDSFAKGLEDCYINYVSIEAIVDNKFDIEDKEFKHTVLVDNLFVYVRPSVIFEFCNYHKVLSLKQVVKQLKESGYVYEDKTGHNYVKGVNENFVFLPLFRSKIKFDFKGLPGSIKYSSDLPLVIYPREDFI